MSINHSVEEELAKIKAEQAKKKNKKKSVESETDSSSGSQEIEAK